MKRSTVYVVLFLFACVVHQLIFMAWPSVLSGLVLGYLLGGACAVDGMQRRDMKLAHMAGTLKSVRKSLEYERRASSLTGIPKLDVGIKAVVRDGVRQAVRREVQPGTQISVSFPMPDVYKAAGGDEQVRKILEDE